MISKYYNIFGDNEVNLIWNYLRRPNWEFWHTSLEENTNFFWHMRLEGYSFFTGELFTQIKSFIGDNFLIERVYANGQTYSLDGNLHTDTDELNGYTFLYYPMKTWNIEWGGETVIIDPDNQVNYIQPIPNSAVLFPGHWVHYGRGPLKGYNDLRVSIAYKLLQF